MTRAETLRVWMEFLNQTFGPFMQGGGTIIAITGNHDNDNFAQVLRQAMTLAAPTPTDLGGLLGPGRFYLFTGPTFFRLAGKDGDEVQFIAMPSPTPTRYLSADELQSYQSKEERHRAIKANFTSKIKSCFTHPSFDTRRQTVLAAHILTSGAEVSAGVRVSETSGVVMSDAELPTHLAYVALGDVHKPQALMGLAHVRYCGSIERMDLGEAADETSRLARDVEAKKRLIARMKLQM
jgi:exonuclease SbcD